MHTFIAGHAMPHAPQFIGSAPRLMQLAPQRVVGTGHEPPSLVAVASIAIAASGLVTAPSPELVASIGTAPSGGSVEPSLLPPASRESAFASPGIEGALQPATRIAASEMLVSARALDRFTAFMTAANVPEP